MSDKVEEAIDTVARYVLASQCEDIYGEWEVFPEIGEHDWEQVCERTTYLARFPAFKDLRAAYELLASRAPTLIPADSIPKEHP